MDKKPGARKMKAKRKSTARVRAGKRTARKVKHREARTRGHSFEKQVATWFKTHFPVKEEGVKTNIHLLGQSKRMPYEVDVYAVKDGLGSYAAWIECKDLKTTVKAKQIEELLSKAKEVRAANKTGREPKKVTTVIFVSKRNNTEGKGSYFEDALTYATSKKVPCYEKTQRGFQLVNKIKVRNMFGEVLHNVK